MTRTVRAEHRYTPEIAEVRRKLAHRHSTVNNYDNSLQLLLARQARLLPGVGPLATGPFLKRLYSLIGAAPHELEPEYRYTARERQFARDKARGQATNVAGVYLGGFIEVDSRDTQEARDRAELLAREQHLSRTLEIDERYIEGLGYSEAATSDLQAVLKPCYKELHELVELREWREGAEERRRAEWEEEKEKMREEEKRKEQEAALWQTEWKRRKAEEEAAQKEDRRKEAEKRAEKQEESAAVDLSALSPKLAELVKLAALYCPHSLARVQGDALRPTAQLEADLSGCVELYRPQEAPEKKRKFPYLV